MNGRGIAKIANAALVSFAAALALSSAPIVAGGCQSSWCQPGAVRADQIHLIDRQYATITAGRDCWTPGQRKTDIPGTVIVRGARVDTAVVWAMTLDQAFARNRDGDRWNDVYVMAGCR